MIRRLRIALLVVLAAAFALGSSAAQKKTYVKPYTKKDGTHVKGHERKTSEKGTKSKSSPKGTKSKSSTPKPAKAKRQSSVKTTSGVARDERGRIQRSDAARHSFARQTGYPKGRPGYVIDHIVPLACGGKDDPSNMQWQTVAAAKAKDKVERKGCR
jgi:hypothetical protein